jgi:hypothetical protein
LVVGSYYEAWNAAISPEFSGQVVQSPPESR